MKIPRRRQKPKSLQMLTKELKIKNEYTLRLASLGTTRSCFLESPERMYRYREVMSRRQNRTDTEKTFPSFPSYINPGGSRPEPRMPDTGPYP